MHKPTGESVRTTTAYAMHEHAPTRMRAHTLGVARRRGAGASAAPTRLADRAAVRRAGDGWALNGRELDELIALYERSFAAGLLHLAGANVRAATGADPAAETDEDDEDEDEDEEGDQEARAAARADRRQRRRVGHTGSLLPKPLRPRTHHDSGGLTKLYAAAVEVHHRAAPLPAAAAAEKSDGLKPLDRATRGLLESPAAAVGGDVPLQTLRSFLTTRQRGSALLRAPHRTALARPLQH